MQIKNIETRLLIPYGRNARKNQNTIDKVASSIKEFGFQQPIVVDKQNVIVCGHTRFEAAKKLGLETVPCQIADNLTEAQIRAYRILDNKIQESSEWDFEMLELELEDLDFDFTEFDVDFAIEENLPTPEAQEDDFEIPDENQITTNVKYGDIIEIGNHRLMCGDSTKIEDVEKLMNGQKADMVFTDPPYDMQMGGQGCWASSTQNIKKRIDKIINFDANVLCFLPDLNIPSYYIFTSKNAIPDYLNIFKDFNFNILIWCKTNPTPFTSGSFLPDVEYLLFFSKKGQKIWNNSLKPTEVYKKYYIGSKLEGREGGVGEHPTMKPLRIINDKIRISSNKNGIVLDLFLGSGSTMVAAHQLDRTCYGMELEPKYCQVIIDRMKKLDETLEVKINGEKS